MERPMGPSFPYLLTLSPLPWLRLGTLEQKLQGEEKTQLKVLPSLGSDWSLSSPGPVEGHRVSHTTRLCSLGD